MIKNIIFDWSGTISDDMRTIYLASALLCKRLGSNFISFGTFKERMTGENDVFIGNEYFPHIKKEEFYHMFSETIHEVEEPKPYLGVGETLSKLKELGIQMAVVSMHPHRKLIKEAKDYGFYEVFKEINGSVHDKGKIIKEIMERNKFKPEETVYVGDMTFDIRAGKKAGVKTVASTWGYHDGEFLKKLNPDYMIGDIKELIPLVSLR